MFHDVHVLTAFEMTKEGMRRGESLACIQLMTCLPLELDDSECRPSRGMTFCQRALSRLESKRWLMKYRDLNTRATECKRQGDLVRANELYCESFKIEPKYSSEVIWGWVKVLLLAKDWEGAKKVLEYHEMMMVAWMRLMRDEGNEQYFREIRMWGKRAPV